MSKIFVNRESDFKNENISTIPLGINNISIQNDSNIDLRNDNINNSKPMLSSNSNSITIPNGRKVKIRPTLNTKKVPVSTFSAMANPKKNMSGNNSDESVSDGSFEDESDDILSNNSRSNYKVENRNQEDDEDEDEYTEDNEDYTSVASSIPKNNKNTKSSRHTDDVSEYTEEDDDEEEDDESVPVKQKTYEEIQQEKQEILFNLERLQKQGYPPSKKYSMASSYEDMKYEFDRLKKQRDVEKSIRMSRKFLMAFVSGVELLNDKFDYFDIKLNGWSENVMENVSDYDEVFEELHDKYSGSIKMAPELRLLALLAGSGVMFHITNSIFKSASPKLSDILKNNPDIMKSVSEAAMKNAGSNIDDHLGQNNPLGDFMKSGINMKMNQQQKSFPQKPSNNQPKMNGPVGIDELLNELNNQDDGSVASSNESVNMKSFGKRSVKGKKGGFSLNI
jgi:hypothetical protein